ADGPGQLADVRHALFEEVGAALGPAVEESDGVGRLGVLAQDDHAHVGGAVAQGSPGGRTPPPTRELSSAKTIRTAMAPHCRPEPSCAYPASDLPRREI